MLERSLWLASPSDQLASLVWLEFFRSFCGNDKKNKKKVTLNYKVTLNRKFYLKTKVRRLIYTPTLK